MQVGQDVLSVNSGAALNEKRSKGRAGSDAAQGRPRKVEFGETSLKGSRSNRGHNNKIIVIIIQDS